MNPRDRMCKSPPLGTFTDSTAPVRVFDGWGDLALPWQPRSFILEVRQRQGTPPAKWVAVQPTGQVSVRFVGLCSGGEYIRDFQLGLWQSFRFDLNGFSSARVEVMANSLANAELLATLSEDPLVSRGDPYLLLPLVYAVAGTYGVPAGAIEVTPVAADGAFTWLGSDVTGSAVNVPTPLVAGTTQTVQGARFTSTVPGLGLMWRIRV